MDVVHFEPAPLRLIQVPNKSLLDVLERRCWTVVDFDRLRDLILQLLK